MAPQPFVSILVVDDDVDNTANFADILRELGYGVQTANDGHTALRLFEKHRFDIALLDFKMPDTNGAELYRQLRDAQPQSVAIMITAYAGETGVRRAKDAGTWKVLHKPVDMSHLIEVIGDAMRQSA